MARKTKRNTKRDPALAHAIAAAGGAAKLARALGITVQGVCGWTKCPPRRALAIEMATGGVVKRDRLCPGVFAA